MKPPTLPSFIGFDHPQFDDLFASYHSPMKWRVIFCWLVFISLLVFVILLNTIEALRPSQESSYSWFERSGALIGACAVFVEFKLKLIDTILHSASMSFKPDVYQKLIKYDVYKNYLHWMALTYGIVGTLIWSYGSPFLILLSKLAKMVGS
ncbi:MAG: hypothetical protein ACJAUJ_001702 [Salibacteraceae bacterium]|jgi:hypothetical protein